MNKIKTLNSLFIAIISGFLLTTYFTWPFIKYLSTYYLDYGDHAATGWILWNNYKHFFANEGGSYIANQLYPFPYVDVFILNTIIPSLSIFSPLFFLSKNFIFSVNTTIFISLILTYASAFLVFNYFTRANFLRNLFGLTKNKLAAVVAAIIFSFAPLVLGRFVGHAVLLYRFFIPPVFLFFYLFIREPKLKQAVLFYLFLTLNALTNSYFFIASLIFLSLMFLGKIILLKKIPIIAVYLKKFVLASLIGIIFLPFLIAYYKPYHDFSVKEQAERKIEENIFFAAEASDFFLGLPQNKFFGSWYTKNVPEKNYPEYSLFFGFLAYSVLITAPFFLLSKKNKSNKKLVLMSYFLIFLAMILSLGPYLREGQLINVNFKLPYYYLYQYLFIFKSMRVPSRIMLVAVFFVALITVIFVSCLFKKTWKLFYFLIILFLLFEYKNHYAFESYKQIPLERKKMLQHKKILFLPDFVEKFYAYNAKYINLAILNDFTIVNGYSAYYPAEHLSLMTYFNKNRFQEDWLDTLKAMKIDYVIFDKTEYKNNYQTQLEIDFPKDYYHLKIFEDKTWLILDINKYPKDFCYQDDFSKLGVEFFANPVYSQKGPLVIGFKLTNNSACAMRFFYEQRYVKMTTFLQDAFFNKPRLRRDLYLAVKPIILPKETVLVTMTVVDEVKVEPGIYLVNTIINDKSQKNFSRKIIIQ